MQSLKNHKKPVNTTFGVILFFSFWAGLILAGFSITLYEATFIPFYVAVIIYIGPALLLTPLVLKMLFRERPRYVVVKCFMIAIGNVAGMGGILLYTFMAVNFYNVDDSAVTTQKVPIVARGFNKYKTSTVPYVVVKYKNLSKEFQCPYDYSPVYEFHELQVTVNRGYFGFDVVKKEEFLK